MCFSENQVRPRKSTSSQCDIGSDQFFLLESQELLSREVVLFQVVVTRPRDPGLAQARVPSGNKLASLQDVCMYTYQLRTQGDFSHQHESVGEAAFFDQGGDARNATSLQHICKPANSRVKDREHTRRTIYTAITEGCVSGGEKPSLIIGGPHPQFCGRRVVCCSDTEF